MSCPFGVRPWKTQRDLPLDQVTAWEIDSKGELDEHGEPLRRLRRKVTGTMAKAAARRRTWLLSLTAEGEEAPPEPEPKPKPATPATGKKALVVGKSTTLREYFEGPYYRVMEKTLRSSTIYNRVGMVKAQILPVLGDYTLTEANTVEAHDMLRDALDAAKGQRNGKRLSINYKNQILVLLGAILTVAADPKRNTVPIIAHRLSIDHYRAKDIPNRETVMVGKVRWGEDRHKRYSDEELDRIEAAIETDWETVAMGLGLYGGCRISEACARTYDDVDTKEGRIYVGTQVTLQTRTDPSQIGETKNSQTGWIRVPPEFLEAVERLRQTATNPYILFHPQAGLEWHRGQHPFLNRNQVGYRWAKLCRRAGVSKRHYHALRHTFCSRMADANVPAERIKELARHLQVATTFKYITPSLVGLDKAAEAAWRRPAPHEKAAE